MNITQLVEAYDEGTYLTARVKGRLKNSDAEDLCFEYLRILAKHGSMQRAEEMLAPWQIDDE